MKPFLTLFFLLFLSLINAQTYYRMDAANDGSTINFTCPISNASFADDGAGSTHYSNGVDRTITFCAPAGKLLKFDFGCGSNLTIERIDPTDTLFIYNGNSTASPLLYAVTGNPSNSDRLPYFNENSSFVFLSTSECITFRFKTDASNNNDGWDACISCVDPISCGNNEPASDLFGGAPYVCNISGYCGTTSGDFGEDYPVNLNPNGGSCPSGLNFLGTIENNSWLKFIADSTSAVFDFNVPLGGACLNGIQTAVFAYDGTTLTRMSPCALSDGSHAGNFQLTASGLTVGETYYIMTDGNAGDVCDYTINVNTGVTTLDAGPNQESCAVGGAINLSAAGPSGATYTWNSLDNVVTNEVGQNITVNPTTPTTYIVEISGGGICQNQFDTVKVTFCAVLPVELINFSAQCKKNEVHLSWQTASEINNNYFLVQKSKDAINFMDKGHVYGAGNSTILLNYSFTDNEPNGNSTTYYRLKQIDFDGAFEFSNVVAVHSCQEEVNTFNNVYVSNNQLVMSYQLVKNQKVNLRIIDLQGRIVVDDSFHLSNDENKFQYNLASNVASAVYFIQLITDKEITTKKILIK